MPATLDSYIDAAITRAGLTSNRDLCRALGLSSSAVNHWRTKRTWPSDLQMIRLATLAGRDPGLAVLHLQCWRAEAPETAELWRDLAADYERDQMPAPAAPEVRAAGADRTETAQPAGRRRGLYIMRHRADALERRFRKGFIKLPAIRIGHTAARPARALVLT